MSGAREIYLSIIVPTRDRDHDVRLMLEGLATQDDLTGVEIILVDDASAVPLVPDALRAPCSLRVLQMQRQTGAAACRNAGARVARGTRLAFLDDDAVPVPDWLTEMNVAFARGALAVTGRVMRFDSDLVSRARQARYDHRYAGLADDDEVGFFSGGNSALLTEEFHAIGGMSNGEVGGDNDVVGALRARGVAVRFQRRMAILHRNSKGVRSALLTAYSAGRNMGRGLDGGDLLRRVIASLGCRNAIGNRLDERLANQLLDMAHVTGLITAERIR